MLRRIRQRRMFSSLRLSDTPEFVACIPGTKTREVSEATVGKYNALIARFIEYLDDDPPVETISRETYAAFNEWLGNRNIKPITINGYRRRCRAIWNRLKARGVDVCDISGIYREELEPPQQSRASSPGHISAMLQIASVRDAAIILYTAAAGFRRQTVARLRVDSTHIWYSDSGELRIASKIPQEKTSPPRIVIGDEIAAMAVKLWLNIRELDSEWLFNEMHNGGQLSHHTVSTIFANLRRAANIPAYAHASAHGLRHRFAQEKLTDHDQKIVAQWMGISVDTMLKVYAHRNEELLLSSRLGDDDFPRELLNGKI